MKVVGMRKFMYTSKKTGETYPAANIFWIEEKNLMRDTVGIQAGEYFVRQSALPDDLAVGSEFVAYYNRFGKVDLIGMLK